MPHDERFPSEDYCAGCDQLIRELEEAHALNDMLVKEIRELEEELSDWRIGGGH